MLRNETPPRIQGHPPFTYRDRKASSSVFRASPGVWVNATGVTGQWTLDDVPIAGQTGEFFSLANLGDKPVDGSLGYVETATDANGSTRRAYSNWLGPIANSAIPGGEPQDRQALQLISLPTVYGYSTQGGELSADGGRWANLASSTGQWLRGNQPIPGATSPRYTTTPQDTGWRLSWRETAIGDAGDQQSATSQGIMIRSANGDELRDLRVHPSRLVQLPGASTGAPRTDGVSSAAQTYPTTMDPHEVHNFGVGFAALLRANEELAEIIEIGLSDASVALGCQIDTEITPFIDRAGKDVGFRLRVETEQQDAAHWQGAGRTIAVNIRARTNHQSYEEHDEWVLLQIRQ